MNIEKINAWLYANIRWMCGPDPELVEEIDELTVFASYVASLNSPDMRHERDVVTAEDLSRMARAVLGWESDRPGTESDERSGNGSRAGLAGEAPTKAPQGRTVLHR